MSHSQIKALFLTVVGFVFFIVFTLTFQPPKLANLFNYTNLSLIFFSYIPLLISFFIFALLTVTVVKDKMYFSAVFIVLSLLAGSFLIMPNKLRPSVVSGLIISLFLIIGIYILRKLSKNYISTPVSKGVSETAKLAAYAFALSISVVFYMTVNLDPSSTEIQKILNITVNKISKQAAAISQEALEDTANEEIQNNSQINQLAEEYNIEGFLENNSLNQLDATQNIQTEAQQKVSEVFKEKANQYLEEYGMYIKIIMSLLLFTYVKFVLTIANIIFVPILNIIYKILESSGYFKKYEEEVTAERVRL